MAEHLNTAPVFKINDLASFNDATGDNHEVAGTDPSSRQPTVVEL